jgi:arginase
MQEGYQSMTTTRLIQVPYDSGNPCQRLGAGPQRLVSGGLPEHLSALGYDVETETVEAQGAFLTENETTFDLMRHTSDRVARADRDGAFPVVLAGNCNTALGTLAGLAPGRVGIIWFDAHGDFRTPGRSRDGFLDAMGLAMIAGLCWPWATATIPGFRPLPPGRILHVAGRLIDEEARFFNRAGVSYLPAPLMHEKGVESTLSGCLDQFADQVDRIDLHLDLDTIDPSIAPASDYARDGGLEPEQVARAFDLIADRVEIGAMDVTGYDPSCDPEGKLVAVALDLVGRVASYRFAA